VPAETDPAVTGARSSH